MSTSQIDLFAGTLPERPYCTDRLGNIEIRKRAQAIARRYIQPNAPWDLRWMVYDVDRETATFDWQDRHVAAPNIVVTNRDNGHAHLMYGLAVPVHLQFGSRKHPLRYAASVDVAMIGALDADPGYAGLLAKNPLHKSWLVQTFQGEAYDLEWLADYLDLSAFTDGRKNLPAVGLGRNCTLFDNLRTWAYRGIRQTWNDLPGVWTFDTWHATVLTKAAAYNAFETPLPFTEIKATAKSVAKYTWTHFTPQAFSAIQRARNRRSQVVRKAKAEQKRETVLEARRKHPEASQRELARMTGIPLQTIHRLLSR